MKKTLSISGMNCEHCVKVVKETLLKIPEVKVLNVKIGEAEIEIPENFSLDLVKNELEDIGYELN